MSKTDILPVKELMSRYETACDFKQAVDRPRIEACLQRWIGGLSQQPVRVRFADTAPDFMQAAWDAWAAWAAWDARAARAAWDARDAWDAWDAWAAWDISWCAIVVIGAAERADGETYARWLPFFEAFEAGAFSLSITETEMVVTTLPNFVKVDDRRRLHAASGPAFSWMHDVREFYWHGVNVPAHVVDDPAKITVAEIDKETNAEVRRVMIERYGEARYLKDSGATEVGRDDYGILLRKELPGDEPIVMVQLLNSTPEPDGTLTREDAEATFGKVAVANVLTYASSRGVDCTEPRFKTYMLRVPPDMQSAHQAVAWTFGKTTKTYCPLAQS